MEYSENYFVPSPEDGPVMEDIRGALQHQVDKFGQQNHRPTKWMIVLMEEVGEAARAVEDNKKKDYRKEMLQVAAVAIAAVDALDRGY